MTDHSHDSAHPVPDDVLAAEFVLGLLDLTAHARAERRAASDPDFARKVLFWQTHLASLDVEVDRVAPPDVFPKIEARLFGSPRKLVWSGLWNDLRVWRALAAGALLVAMIVVGLSAFQPGIVSDTNQQTLVASLQAEGSDASFLALCDVKSGRVRLTGVSGEVIAGKDYELWIIPDGKDPISLGVVPISGTAEVALADNLKAYANPSSILAVTLEPLGGAPEGKPTGPVVAAGTMTTI
ncbi:MAG: anti-sigma factor [Hyphomicrobiaceae bacterium]|nr:anti-sigma factor [Hyphomicrobiaceae bacterium]MCC0022772.1 anti-sigma factor [Hyphomicrobiaceae bacterium]